MTQPTFAPHVEDRMIRNCSGSWRVETRLLDDDMPGCWHVLDSLLSQQQAQALIQRRADLRARTPKH